MMGAFDEQIAWCRERRKIAREDLKDYEAGIRLFREEGTDVTDNLIAKAKSDIDLMDRLISAYEAERA